MSAAYYGQTPCHVLGFYNTLLILMVHPAANTPSKVALVLCLPPETKLRLTRRMGRNLGVDFGPKFGNHARTVTRDLEFPEISRQPLAMTDVGHNRASSTAARIRR